MDNDGEQNSTISDTIIDLKALDASLLSAVIKLELDTLPGELSATPLVNSKEEVYFPREVILSDLSSACIQAELVRPIFAGTYNELPACLLRFRFNFQIGKSRWNRRIKEAIINIVFEDARNDTVAVEQFDWDSEGHAEHPTIARWFPADEGWEGPISTATLQQGVVVGLGAGASGTIGSASAGLNLNRSMSQEREGAARITTLRTGGSSLNILRTTLTENPISCAGIPIFFQLPVIIVHTQTRFKMRVTVKATCGFWHSNFAMSVPIRGKLDEPLFFDPEVLRNMMIDRKKGKDGTRVVEHLGELFGVDLQEHSSLARNKA